MRFYKVLTQIIGLLALERGEASIGKSTLV
jgi:hypothetical protein